MTSSFDARAWALLALACVLSLASGCGDDDAASEAEPKTHDPRRTGDADSGTASSAAVDDASACDTLKCACEQFCAKVDHLNCAGDPTYDDCVSGCAPEDNHSCREQQRGLAACRGDIPQLSYHCDPVTKEFAVAGCEPEQEAYANCVFPPDQP